MALQIIQTNKKSKVLMHSENMMWVQNHLDHMDNEDPKSTRELERDYYCVSFNNKIIPINGHITEPSQEVIKPARTSYIPSHERI